jgi:LysM repeat protein
MIEIPEVTETESQGKVLKKEKHTERKESANPLESAFKYIEQGKKYEARNMLSDLYLRETDQSTKSKIKEQLDILNSEIVFSQVSSPDAFFYTVKAGDSLVKIADNFKIPYKLIMQINNKNRSLIRVGERLKILKGEISLLADKSDFSLTVLLDGHYLKQFPVGIGKNNKTPVGVFFVKDKLVNPVWYSPEGVFPFGHPKNVLGTRWIGFEEQEGLYGYGIHGTAEPESIGKAESNGCIRLRNEDVEELFDFVETKTKVVIQE